MNENKSILPECYVDSCLIEVLLHAGRDYVNHQKGNGTVAKKMQAEFNNDFCVGIIDEDRRPLDYLKEFDLKKSSESLKLWKHKMKHHYFIQVCPVIEKLIRHECEERNINLLEFDLPVGLKELTKLSKSISSKNDPRFIALFKTMIHKHCDSILELQKWIEYLRREKYEADINEL